MGMQGTMNGMGEGAVARDMPGDGTQGNGAWRDGAGGRRPAPRSGRSAHARSAQVSGGRGATRVARGLGWFSLALGAAELLLPATLARATGLQGREALLRGYGVREVVTGVGLLTAEQPGPWMWARVAGDALDLGALAARSGQDDRRWHGGRDAGPPVGTLVALAAVAGVLVLDLACARSLAANRRRNRVVHDYGDRIGMARTPAEMRGMARHLKLPRDMRTPEAMRRLDRAEGWADEAGRRAQAVELNPAAPVPR